MSERLGVVAVVGRPNVGKSTLVNRIVGGRPAVVEERPGVTRDRRELEAEWDGRRFLVVDTGGWEMGGDDLTEEVRRQAEVAVDTADVVLLVVDATTGITEEDAQVAEVLRGRDVPVVLVANKVDHPARSEPDLWKLGMGEPVEVSALHGRGVSDLLDRTVALLPESPPRPEELPRLTIVGRPNVGKSTLLNRLVGEDRVIVSPRPGTTRDPIDVRVELGGRPYLLVDTAGIRRRSRIGEDADYFAVLRARQAVERSDVALLVVDASEGITHQDQRIAAEVAEAGAGLVVLLNKWDLLDEEARLRVESGLSDRLGFVGWAPVLRVSALTGSRLHRLGDLVSSVLEARSRRIPTGVLNRMVRGWVDAHPPPVRKGRRPSIHYMVQADVAPPTFVVFASGGPVGEDYLRYLENRIRQVEDFTGSPIRVITRRKGRRSA
jgi:GTP-binding protein